MNTFRFSLERVLDWRRVQLEIEESNYRKQLAGLAEMDRQREELRASGRAAEEQVRVWERVAGRELQGLGGFRTRVQTLERGMHTARVAACRRLAAQQNLMLEASRRVRLLERLKERRLAEWRAGFEKELEENAAESYLARWSGRRRPTYNEVHDA
jgi:hypothetical protein